ncbi:glycosyltransferase [Paenibacillus sp. 1001270B_150601_E10]|uniref:glycosyltransferase n=1 Tax=Paenibacillus sp. 1001270B_150601_E10 TaxID=2787079 RepID=UPI00189EC2A4|nr:glycosyltransferase [Paenibacillus sp. 1001270B_150601_E10]
MITVSLCMIVKNEEDTLPRCLSSVKDIVQEIIIVDTGSTDKTKEVACTFTDHVVDFKWIHDFAAARNHAFSLATQEYILWLDADDVFCEKDRVRLKKLLLNLDPIYDSVTMEYHLAFDEYGNVTSRNRRNRLVKRSNGFKWIGKVHEYLEVWGSIFNSDVAVTHASVRHDHNRNISIYEEALRSGESFTPRDLYYYANELKDHGQYHKAIEYYNQFLNTEKGWIEDVLATCGKLADCYHALKDGDGELSSSLRALHYAAPRPDTCCRLGYYFLTKGDYQSAIFWYENAVRTSVSRENLGFVNVACSTWLPHLQLCVCYDRVGQHQAAYDHNQKALQFRPNDKRMQHNKAYLEGLLGIGDSADPASNNQKDSMLEEQV